MSGALRISVSTPLLQGCNPDAAEGGGDLPVARAAIENQTRQLTHPIRQPTVQHRLTIPGKGEYVGEVHNGNPHGWGVLTYSPMDKKVKYEGNWNRGQAEGEGTLTFRNGARYTGQFRDNLYHGIGVCEDSGNRYEGQWQGSKRSGQGTETYHTGGRYVGNFSNDQINGMGMYTYRNGDTYVGMWKDGKKHGHGKFTSASGNVWEGEYVNDSQHRANYDPVAFAAQLPSSTNIFPEDLQKTVAIRTPSFIHILALQDGQYTGEIEDGVPHGVGSLIYAQPSSLKSYEGEWVKGVKQGKGILSWESGEKYSGDFVAGLREGMGLYEWSNGTRYYGGWKKGKRSGKGLEMTKDGFGYQGDYVDSQKHGYGINMYSTGGRYEGEWVNNKRHGRGILFGSNGMVYDGMFRNDNSMNPSFCHDSDTYGPCRTVNAEDYVGPEGSNQQEISTQIRSSLKTGMLNNQGKIFAWGALESGVVSGISAAIPGAIFVGPVGGVLGALTGFIAGGIGGGVGKLIYTRMYNPRTNNKMCSVSTAYLSGYTLSNTVGLGLGALFGSLAFSNNSLGLSGIQTGLIVGAVGGITGLKPWLMWGTGFCIYKNVLPSCWMSSIRSPV